MRNRLSRSSRPYGWLAILYFGLAITFPAALYVMFSLSKPNPYAAIFCLFFGLPIGFVCANLWGVVVHHDDLAPLTRRYWILAAVALEIVTFIGLIFVVALQ